MQLLGQLSRAGFAAFRVTFAAGELPLFVRG